jgi:hypothetical protein
MRARVRVGEIRRRSTGATRSGLIGNSRSSSSFGSGPEALAGLQLQQLFGVDGDRVGLDRRRRGDRAGDDLALRQQAFDAGVDQPFAELVEIENAGDEDDEPARLRTGYGASGSKRPRAEDAANEVKGSRPGPVEPRGKRLELPRAHVGLPGGSLQCRSIASCICCVHRAM